MKYTFEERKVVCKGDYWIADNAVVIGSVVLENNASVWFNCVLRGDNDVITRNILSAKTRSCIKTSFNGLVSGSKGIWLLGSTSIQTSRGRV